jgi:hypothetical protein
VRHRFAHAQASSQYSVHLGSPSYGLMTAKTCFSTERGYFSAMSKIEEIERAVEQLPLTEFVKEAVIN